MSPQKNLPSAPQRLHKPIHGGTGNIPADNFAAIDQKRREHRRLAAAVRHAVNVLPARFARQTGKRKPRLFIERIVPLINIRKHGRNLHVADRNRLGRRLPAARGEKRQPLCVLLPRRAVRTGNVRGNHHRRAQNPREHAQEKPPHPFVKRNRHAICLLPENSV